MYYALVIIAVTMFSIQYYCNKEYQKLCGSGFFSSMVLTFGGSLAGLIALLLINKFRVGFTFFTLFMAVFNALNGILCTLCSQKALGHINLSLFSVFSQLGGMAIPFVTGVLFFDEDMTKGKAICLLAIIIAMSMTLNKDSKKGSKFAVYYYLGIFIFNGLAGFFSKIFTSAPYPKTDAASYSIIHIALTVIISVIISGIILLYMIIKDRTKINSAVKKFRLTLPVTLWMSGGTVLNKVANLLLLIALVHLPASVQYPMVTGGIMIISTLLCYLTPNKPSPKEIGAVALSFAGIMALVFIP